MSLDIENSFLVVVDVQEVLFPHINKHKYLLQNILKTLKCFEILQVPILTVEQYPKGLGSSIDEIVDVLGDKYEPLDKSTFSCYGDEKIKSVIKNIDRKNAILLGIETHICVFQSALDLHKDGYRVFVLGDCVNSRSKHNHFFGLELLRDNDIKVYSYESAIFELLKSSKHDKFKEVQALLK